MKRKHIATFLIAAILSCALAVSAVGCMVTGLDLPVENTAAVFWICGAVSLLCSFLFLWKRGGWVLACLMAVLGGYLWHRGILRQQVLSLLNQISHIYDRAYGWGVLLLGESNAPVDIPMAILGGLIAISASRTFCRGKGALLTLLLSAAPLASCLVVTDTVPETGFLFVLMAGLILLLLTFGVRRDNILQGNRLTVTAALPVLLALAALFWAVPQESYVNHSKEIQEQILSYVETLPQLAENAIEEVTIEIQGDEQRNMDLKSLGARPRYTYAVMDITAEASGVLYLRGQDYDSYSGTGWTSSNHRAEEFSCTGEPAGSVTIQTRNHKELLYLPYYPSDGAALIGGIARNEDSAKEYTVSRTALPENWRELAEQNIPEDDGQIYLTSLELKAFGSTAERLRYVTLPGETDIRAQEILNAILPENATRIETADIIADYVRNSAEYDLNTGRMPADQEDFALWFLTESDTGYCVHFATAAVVLLRAADIPARYVSGYMVQAQAGETVTATGGNAHAWAEYYVPQLEAWVVLEATPAEALVEATEPTATEGTTQPTVETNASQAPSLPPHTTAPETETAAPSEGPAKPISQSAGQWALRLLALAAGILLLFAQRSLRLTLRKAAQRSGTPNAQALARWKEAELLARLLKQAPPEELMELAQKAKFSQHTLTADELLRFDCYHRACRQQLKSKPWYIRLVHQYVFAVY